MHVLVDHKIIQYQRTEPRNTQALFETRSEIWLRDKNIVSYTTGERDHFYICWGQFGSIYQNWRYPLTQQFYLKKIYSTEIQSQMQKGLFAEMFIIYMHI